MTDFYDDLNLGRFQDNINSYGINSPVIRLFIRIMIFQN